MTPPASQSLPAASAGAIPLCAVSIIDATGRLGEQAVSYLHLHAGAAMKHLGVRGEVRVRVVSDREMSAAHVEYLETPGTTDVITFDLSEPSDPPDARLDVDILACLDEALRQGAARDHAPERELLLYVVHGVLHCLGFDDHDEAQAAAMHAREDEILRAIGVGDTFQSGEKP